MGLSLPRQLKNINIQLLLLLATGLLGVFGIAYFFKENYQEEKKEISAPTVLAKYENLTIKIKANGVVQARHRINISPKESARIAEILVQEGDVVTQGQVIARMDDSLLLAQIQQYQANVAKTEAELAEKIAGNRPEDIAELQAKVLAEQANLAQEQAKLHQAESEVKRYENLANQGAISQLELERFVATKQQQQAALQAAKARLLEQQQIFSRIQKGNRWETIASAKANLDQAKAQLNFYQTQQGDTIIRAPFSGVITRQFAQSGDFVTPTTTASTSEGSTSTSIVELSSGLEIEAKVPEASIAQIQIGQSIDIQFDAYSNITFKGRVRLIAPAAIKQDNVTLFRVKAYFVGHQYQYKVQTGMNANLNFQVNQIQKALVIPLAAIITQKDGTTGVLVADSKNQPIFKPVKLGQVSGSQAQIITGLSVNEQVFLSPPADHKIEGVDTISF